MRQVEVSIEINGKQIPVGSISGGNKKDYVFQYREEYLRQSGSAPISVSLPLREEPFSPKQTASFFDGLLPEGFTRRAVAQWMHQETEDYLSILSGLGRECLGAIQVHTEEERPLLPSYEKLSLSQVKELAREGAVYTAELVTKAHISLTGATGKVGLYYQPDKDLWYLPHGTAPSTHIVKQSHVRLKSIVVNEQLSLLTASLMGVETPDSFIINMGEGRDEDVLLATPRYDRIIDKTSGRIDGLPVPYRLHQEDFSQALGVPAGEKYEKNFSGEKGYLSRAFSLLRKVSANPLEDQLKLWDRIVVSFLIGNTDSHLKNFSLLYGRNLQEIRLAPAYDLVSTVVYRSSTRDMSFYIGDKLSLDDINRESFRSAAELCRLNPAMAMKRLDMLADKFENCLREAGRRLSDQGLPGVDGIMDKILQSAGYRLLFSN